MNKLTTFMALAFAVAFGSGAYAAVRLERVPEEGVQPQIAVTKDGSVHLVYLKGAPAGCDVRYTWKAASAAAWHEPVTVNSLPHTAIAIGSIRGAQIACGKDGAVHVVWNAPISPAKGGGEPSSALYYSRMAGPGQAFAPQRDLISGTRFLDGGASLAADDAGRVFIVWHAAPPGNARGEGNRAVFVLRSVDKGETFGPRETANADYTGVCACCSLKAFVDPAGELLTLYRAARETSERDITLLRSAASDSFSHEILHPWAIGACPMSSMTMIATREKVRAAWETDGRIFTSVLGQVGTPLAVSGAKARHPSLAANARGEVLVAWSTGTGWQKGGGLAWVVLNASGTPNPERGEAPGVPVWSFPAAYAESDQQFVIFH